MILINLVRNLLNGGHVATHGLFASLGSTKRLQIFIAWFVSPCGCMNISVVVATLEIVVGSN